MTYAPTTLLHVYLDINQRCKVGRLAYKAHRILFEYDAAFISSGIEISPFKLPLQSYVCVCTDTIFGGLYGVFNDSLPDGWGRLLFDRHVEQHGIKRQQLNALDRLAYVGSRGMGALSYEPDRSDTNFNTQPLLLDKLAQEATIVLKGTHEEVFTELLQLSGGSSGARPKIVVQVNTDKTNMIHSNQIAPDGFEDWLIKFPSMQDQHDIGSIEFAYSLMAKAAGVDMPATHLFCTKQASYFGIQRFDRQHHKRVHMHSLSGLLHADHRYPVFDYDTLLRVVLLLTKRMIDVEKAYVLACFNVLAHNRDDHTKNFSCLMNEQYEWVFAPAYDLTFSYGPGGEQSTMVLGEGRNPGKQQLLALGKKHNIQHPTSVIDKVCLALTQWRQYAKQAGVTKKSMQEIEGVLQQNI